MEHWFDRVTKMLARDHMPRRDVLKTAAVGGLAFLLPQISWAQPNAARSPCTISRGAGKRTTTTSSSTTYRGQPLTLSATLTTSVDARSGSGTFHQRIQLGRAIISEIAYDFVRGYKKGGNAKSPASAPLGLVTIRYGAPIHGPNHALLKIFDKEEVQGFVDGHPIAKGRPAPVKVEIAADLQNAMRTLGASARSNLNRCGGGAPNKVEAITDACRQCQKDCDIKNAACMAAAEALLIAGQVVEYGIAVGGCVYNMYDCNDGCNKEGGPCCGVQCSFGCCGQNQTCCGGLQGAPAACCDSGAVCVSGQVDSHHYSYCCPAGSDPEGCHYGSGTGTWYADHCKEPGQTCCGPNACDGACANPDYGICCPDSQGFCYGSCCDGQCIRLLVGTPNENGYCCAQPNLPCGDAGCCPTANCLTSPSGKKVCCDRPLCGEVCCEPPSTCHNGRCGLGVPCGNTFCGAADGPCCKGVCCKPNQTCGSDGRCHGPTCAVGQVPCPNTPGMCCPPRWQCCPQTKSCCDPSKTECCGPRGCVPKGTCLQ